MLPLLAVTVVNLVSVPLFYRYLGAEMYALWFYVLTFTGAFGFMDLGIGVAVGRYMGLALGKGDLEAVREYWGTGNAIVIPLLALMALLFTAVGVWFGPRWFNVAPSHVSLLRGSFIAGGAGLFLSYYGQYWLILSQAHLDFKFLGVLRTAISLLQVIPSIPLAWATGNPLILIGWAALTTLLQLGIFIWHARKTYRLGFSFAYARKTRAREMATYTSKTFGSMLVNALLGSVDRLTLGKLAPAADFAHYTICTNAGGRIQGLSQAVMGPVYNHTSRALGSGHSVVAVYDQTFNFVFPWYVLAMVWAAVWHPALLHLWLGPTLGAAVEPLFTPIFIGCCLTAIANISGAQLGPLNRVGTGTGFSLAAGLLLIAGVYLGWRWGGIGGVAWGFLFSRVAYIAQDLYVIHLIGAEGWWSARTWRVVWRQGGLGLAFSCTMLWLSRDSLWNIGPALVHAGFAAFLALDMPGKRLGEIIRSRFSPLIRTK